MAVRIPYWVARQIADHAAGQQPKEACGLLAGNSEHILAAYPLTNMASAPEARFEIHPGEQLRALKAIDEAKLDWIGAYHSHPDSAPIPSRADIEECADSGLLQLIVSLRRRKPQLKLWHIERESVAPIELIFESDNPPQSEPALSPPQQAAVIVAAIAAVVILLIISFTLLPPAPQISPAS